MRNPRFSVVMPLYNKADYVANAIESVLSQTGHEIEIVVVDDGSTDGSADIVGTLKDPRIRLLRQDNSGVSAARNVGIRAAQGEFIAFLDADDYYLPGFFDAITALISQFPRAGIFSTNFRRVWNDGKSLANSVRRIPSSGSDVLVTDFYDVWSAGPIFFTSSVVVPRQLFFKHNIFFPVGERLGEDQDVWFRLAECQQVAYCRQELAAYRVGNYESLSSGPVPTELLPCIERLKNRLDERRVPRILRRGARRLIATHLVSTARARIAAGRRTGVLEYLGDRRAWSRPLSLIRTWFMLLFHA